MNSIISQRDADIILFNNIIRLSEKFLLFHKMIIDEEQFLFYIILLN